MNIREIAKQIGVVAVKHSPTILTGLGIFSLGGTVIFAVQAGSKAKTVLEEMQSERDDDYPITKKEWLINVAPIYLPTVGMACVTAACMIGSTSISLKRQAITMTALSASEIALKEYQSKVLDTLGEKKESKIRDEIAKDHMDANPVSQNTVFITGKGDSLCYDSWSGRYFQTDYEKVRAAVNTFNSDVISDMWTPLNDFYYYLGLSSVESARDVGFDVDYLLDVRFSSHISDDNRPCLVIEYARQPKPRL